MWCASRGRLWCACSACIPAVPSHWPCFHFEDIQLSLSQLMWSGSAQPQEWGAVTCPWAMRRNPLGLNIRMGSRMGLCSVLSTRDNWDPIQNFGWSFCKNRLDLSYWLLTPTSTRADRRAAVTSGNFSWALLKMCFCPCLFTNWSI